LKTICVYPAKAQFIIGEEIKIKVELNNAVEAGSTLICNIYRLQESLFKIEKTVLKGDKEIVFSFNLNNRERYMTGYGVKVEVQRLDGNYNAYYTAFDVVDSWTRAPRYGFISDFSDSDMNDEEDIKEMNRYHINVVQYYDWMYRHHKFIPPKDKFIDPLKRKLNLSVVKQKVEYAHKYGMKAMAYGAVYGAGKEFYEKHKEWALYKNDGKVYGFGDFLYIMDINRQCKWHDHIINQFLEAVKFGFDGIHMDQYGFPKEAISSLEGEKSIRYLQGDFPKLIDDTKDYIKSKGYNAELIFNAVNNWPVEKVAKAKEDAVYIEVWPPNDTYESLYNLISNAKKYAPQKQVILAAYMRPFLEELNIPLKSAENAAFLTMAVIFASGGFHLLLGEGNGILDDAYYPKYRTINDEEFNKRLRGYYDFIVRYEGLLYDFDISDITMTYTGGINGEYAFSGSEFSVKPKDNCVWTLIKDKAGYKIINLLNFTGITDMRWNEPKDSEPREIRNIEVTAMLAEEAKGIYTASPDINNGVSEKLNFEYVKNENGRAVRFTVPNLKIWNLIYIKL
jgi:dextranase